MREHKDTGAVIRVKIRICGTVCWFWETLRVLPGQRARDVALSHVARWNSNLEGRNAWRFAGYIHYIQR